MILAVDVDYRQGATVAGVAFEQWHSAETHLIRGQSQKPLYITSVGLPLADAKSHIAAMHGDYRMPTLLKKVDAFCRGRD